jgi:hypothetical protein
MNFHLDYTQGRQCVDVQLKNEHPLKMVRRNIETKDPEGVTGEASSNTYSAAMGVYLRCVWCNLFV